MVLIMTPLTVMSFKAIRKKMNAKTWKKIQRLAYIFYACIYVHILVLFVPKAQKGRDGYFLSILVYSAVFIGYAVMRIRKYYIANKKPEKKLVPNTVCACAFALPLVLAGVVSRSNESGKTTAPTSETPVTFSFEAPKDEPSETVTTAHAATTSKKNKTTTVLTTTGAKKDEKTEETTAEKTEEEPTAAEEQKNDEPAQEQHEEAPADVPQPTYKYKNGEYEAEAEGYAGKVHVKLSVENDAITSISAWADEDDPEYFSDAMNTVIPQIGAKVSADGIDACSGATYSSNGIIEAARKALEQAMN
jgi:uncharacterized protein with FMN-binding domain